ncbi:MAG TPA: mannose-6-phosphate isomerase [Planctomycetes bacterium]|nr:mannose-6-phosphate isomerase [Planctomycetota bacterium]
MGELLLAEPSRVLGRADLDALGRFPLMVKILDAAQNLSLQLHPSRLAGVERGFGDQGKDEVWVVLDAQPGAEVMIGLGDGVSPQGFFEALERGEDPSSLLRRLQAKPGDVFIIPAGTVHSLGSGLLIYELQENSDLTFRVHDWGRLGLDGKPRKLHLQEARETPLSDLADPRVVPRDLGEGLSLLVETEGFRLFRWELPDAVDLWTEGAFVILSVIQGGVEVLGDQGRLNLGEGETGLIPGGTQKVHLNPRGTCTILLSRPGASS